MADEPTIKAIPTKYKGYTFRSRLEARWAVFFDALHVGWEYEKEGYELITTNWETGEPVKGTLWYLPDFWIPEWESFIEIKPQGEVDEEASKKVALLSSQSDRLSFIVAGNPWPGEYGVIVPLWGPDEDRAEFDQSSNGHYWLRSIDRVHDWGIVLNTDRCSWHLAWGHTAYAFHPDRTAYLETAFEAARSAKFGRH